MTAMNSPRKIREPLVSGIFYPESREELLSFVESSLVVADVSGAEAIIAPYAAYRFSGLTAGIAWGATLGRDVKTIFLLAPRHREDERYAFLPESDTFDCPLGPVGIDRDCVEELSGCSTVFSVNDIPHLEEHCVEVHLPFLKVAHPEARLVPILFGKELGNGMRSVSNALDICLSSRKETSLVVVSTNFHTASRPLPEYAERIVASMARRDTSGLSGEAKSNPDAPRGLAAIAALTGMRSFRDSDVRLLKLTDSSAFDEERDNHLGIVHYAAISLGGISR